MRFLIFDIESYPDFFSLCLKEYKNEDLKIEVTSDNMHELQKVINLLAVKSMVFTGFNIKGYDLPILSAMILNYRLYPNNPEVVARKVHDVSKRIINDEYIRFNYNMCTFTDLQDDLVQGASLKTFESNIGRAIEETSVPFGTRKLSASQKVKIVKYNWADVYGTEEMLSSRWEYVQNKITIAKKFNMSPTDSLKKTIAGLSANVLVKNARYKNKDFLNDPIEYTLHDKVKDYVYETLPAWLIEKYTSYDADVGLIERDFVLFDNYITIGEGGAHGIHIKNTNTPNYVLTAVPKKGRLMALIDISSYYPNTAITFDYQSRMIDDKSIFARLIDEKNKLSPIAKGPNSTKEIRDTLSSVKALINATVGAYKQKRSDLYDPQQNVNVCFTGQILILALANELFENTSTDIYQVNTDGLVIEFDDVDAKKVKYYIRKWEHITGLKFDATMVSRLWQHNVNNYIMETTSGKLKIKGRWLDYGLNPFNNLFFRIVKKAVFEYLVHGKPISTTIQDESNPLMFMYTVKTGYTFDGTVLKTSTGEEQLGQVNRIYASTDRLNGGTLHKQKGQSRPLVPDCPQVAKVMNTEVIDLPKDIDYQWYITKATKILESLIRVEL